MTPGQPKRTEWIIEVVRPDAKVPPGFYKVRIKDQRIRLDRERGYVCDTRYIIVEGPHTGKRIHRKGAPNHQREPAI